MKNLSTSDEFKALRSSVSCDKMLSVKESTLISTKKHKKHQMCFMDFVTLGGITLILIGRSAITVFANLTFICW